MAARGKPHNRLQQVRSRSWGAEPAAKGAVRFRLWAPAASKLSLFAHSLGTHLPMRRLEGGWFELETDAVQPGEAYSFVLPSGQRVPDPAAREQIGDVHGPSRLIDPFAYPKRENEWRGRTWEHVVIYELHVGTFTPAGTFAGVAEKLDYLRGLGVSAIELMPVAQFSGSRGWGYDGVLLYAPHVAYGGYRGLRQLVDAAHERGLMVLLDVVYNHFGPEGNYIHLYAPEFFHPEQKTPWGAGIAYDRSPVRDFFIDNAIYWLEELRFDGLRLDAIDQIADPSTPTIVEEIATAVRALIPDRHIHLTTEDDRNITYLHERDARGTARLYNGEWNDDFHHTAHVLATGENDGYYRDYCQGPTRRLARALTEGFVYQGEASPYRDNAKRGVASAHLPPTAFVDFLQNHDQIGNRAFGERLCALAPDAAVEALTAVLLLSPHTPLLFMGEEWGATTSFCYFTDFHGELGKAVREGRRNEFAKWAMFHDPATRDGIPDPNSRQTFDASRLRWDSLDEPHHERRLELTKRLLNLRRREITPRLKGLTGRSGEIIAVQEAGLAVAWRLGDASRLTLVANLGAEPWSMPGAARDHVSKMPDPALLHSSASDAVQDLQSGTLAPWTTIFLLQEADRASP